jgi:hypothetical protein
METHSSTEKNDTDLGIANCRLPNCSICVFASLRR